jgi:hypothetical protein
VRLLDQPIVEPLIILLEVVERRSRTPRHSR